MAIKPCKECGKEISDQAKTCPHCGAPPPSKTKPKLSPVMQFLGAIVVVVAVASGFAGVMFPQQDEKSNDKGAIDLCWKEQSRKSLDPTSSRLIAGACEKMEADFKARYGFSP